jgi:hypothetical protein
MCVHMFVRGDWGGEYGSGAPIFNLHPDRWGRACAKQGEEGHVHVCVRRGACGVCRGGGAGACKGWVMQ